MGKSLYDLNQLNQILGLAQAGNDVARQVLLLTCHQISLSTARALRKDPGLAEDDAQNTCLQVLNILPSIRPVNLPAFFKSMTRNRIFNDMKRCCNHCVSLEEGKQAEPEENNPSGSLLREEEFALLDQALAQLTPKKRQVWDLRIRGFSNSDIGAQMGKRADTISKLATHALDKLRQAFRSAGHEMPPKKKAKPPEGKDETPSHGDNKKETPS